MSRPITAAAVAIAAVVAPAAIVGHLSNRPHHNTTVRAHAAAAASPPEGDGDFTPWAVNDALRAQSERQAVAQWYDGVLRSRFVAAINYAAALESARHAPAAAQPVVTRHTSPTNVIVSTSGGGAMNDPFLTCVVQRESNGIATVVNPSSGTGGLFQDMPTTWRNAAAEIGVSTAQYPRAELAPASVQWQVNEHIYATQGRRPWAGGRYSC